MGHSRVKTTLEIYSHKNEEIQKNTADRFYQKFGLNKYAREVFVSLCTTNNINLHKMKIIEKQKSPNP